MDPWDDDDEWWLDEPLPPAPPPLEEPWPEDGCSRGMVVLGSDVFLDRPGAGPSGPSGSWVDVGAAGFLGLLGRRPGLVSAVQVADAAEVGFEGLDAAGRVDALIALEAHRAWMDSVGVRLLAAIAAGDGSVDGWVREEVAAALRVAPVTAGARLAAAQTLVAELPATVKEPDPVFRTRLVG
jgi:hypothetical protein